MTQRALPSGYYNTVHPHHTHPFWKSLGKYKGILRAQEANKCSFYRLSLAVKFVIKDILLTSSICHQFGDIIISRCHFNCCGVR